MGHLHADRIVWLEAGAFSIRRTCTRVIHRRLDAVSTAFEHICLSSPMTLCGRDWWRIWELLFPIGENLSSGGWIETGPDFPNA